MSQHGNALSRRGFIKGGAVAGAAALTAPAILKGEETIQWKMVTTWPKNFPALGTGANFLANIIEEMSGGRLKIKVFGDKELVGAFEVFDTVSRGTAQMGHGAAYYWKGKHAAAQFFASVPFGFTPQEMNSWLYYGGGLALWRRLYEPFGLLPVPIGNTGVQMGGWFNREIKTLEDLKGLKMRIPGLGGEVLKRAGGTPVSLPGGEIYTALQSGAIDATEWIGPYNDQAFGIYKAAKFYYYPGWHEPGTTLEGIINKKAFESLPKDLQAIVLNACKAANMEMLSELTAKNNDALESLINQHKVQLRRFPDEVLRHFRKLSDEVLEELAATDPLSREIHDSIIKFRKQVSAWHAVSEQMVLNSRQL